MPSTYHPQPLTLNRIFASDHTWTATLSAQKVLTITAVGDIMPGRQITASHPESDFSYLYSDTASLLSPADITLANLESPVTPNCRPFTAGMVFCAPPAHLQAIKAAGIDTLSLANNHAYDQKESGFNSTLQSVASVGITPLPPNIPQFLTIKQQKVALIGFSFIPGLKPITPTNNQLVAIISSASRSADLVIVLPHWGIEYAATPSREQIRLAHLMIDSGADLVLGSHPHWIQPVEIYRGKLIVYSHGNFVFDQFWSIPTRQGIIGNYVFYNRQLVDANFIPIQINLSGQPQPVSSSLEVQLLNRMSFTSWQE